MATVEPVEALALYLAEDLLFGALGAAVFQDYAPDASDSSFDSISVVYNTGGQPAELTLGDDTDRPSFQFLTRDPDAGAARDRLYQVFQALHGLTETDVHGVHFKLINFVQSGPVPLGRDERQRFEFVMNARSMVRGVSR